MKILIFSWRDIKHPQAGGSELFVHEIFKRIAKDNEITLFCGAFPGCKGNEIIDGINIIRRGNRFSVYPLAWIHYFLSLRKKSDFIVDVENGIPFFTNFFSRKKKVLVIHHIHKDVWQKKIVGPIAPLGSFLELKLMPIIYRKVPIITVSPSSRRELRKLFGGDHPTDIVYNAINKKFKPGKKSKDPAILFLGRLKKYKSIEVLLKAVRLLRKKPFFKKLRVDIIGRGEDEERLKKIVKDLEIVNKIKFNGFLEEKDKTRLLQRAWIMVNPSMVEGWSITNIEANACGTPVIGSNVSGIKDSVKDKKTGLLFEYGDAAELADKISFLVGNKKYRQKLSQNAIGWAGNFSWEKSSKEFLNIIRRIKC